ncbi:MAG: hypothetical protein JWO60_3195 [Frankiales bacterium]|nr:hypothetical protein [Frankiales bacterium]
MRRALAVLLPLVLAALLLPAQAAQDERGTYPSAGAPGAREYLLHVPDAVRALPAGETAPLVVFLHGCQQTAGDAAVGTRFSQLADREGFVVLYPEQRRPAGSTAPLADGNGAGCWNWFLPEHQTRGAGEPATLAGLTRDVAARLPVDPRRVYVAGISAGADMATVLGATYPDVFAAVAPVAGCAYASCTDAQGTAALAAMGERRRVVPALVVQGTADVVNDDAMGATALQQWLATDDLADDGAANGSVPQSPTSTTHEGFDAGAVGAPGDPCVGSYRLPCLAGAGLRYPTTRLRYDDAGGRTVVEALVVHGLDHAYSGGDPAGTFVDPAGPDLTREIWAFFSARSR